MSTERFNAHFLFAYPQNTPNPLKGAGLLSSV